MSEAGTGLFGAILARGPCAAAVDDAAMLAAMLEVEAALARAEARAGVVPADAAEAITAAAQADRFDMAALGAAAAASGTPVLPLVDALRAVVGPPADDWVHYGATSQDILDTATMLVSGRAIDALLVDLGAAAEAAAGLARLHRDTPIAGRTLLQHALPTTFGAKAATWLTGLDAAIAHLARARAGLPVQLGGAVGTLAALGDAGPRVLRELAEELDLVEPVLPWHADRTGIADLAGRLGVAAAAIGKPATDLVLLAQTEVGEARDATPGRGGSSTLPGKRNPVAAVAARACAAQAPGLVATLLAAAQSGEHERAAGAWQAEWRPLRELFRAVGSAAAWFRDGLANLDVDAATMRAALDAGSGTIVGERVVGALAPSLGRAAAEAALAAAVAESQASGRPLEATLAERPGIAGRLTTGEVADLLDPTGYLGSAGLFVDRALAAHGRAAGAGTARAAGGSR